MQPLEEELVRLRQLIDSLICRIEILERNSHYRTPITQPYQPTWPVHPYQPTPTYPYDITITCSNNIDWKVA